MDVLRKRVTLRTMFISAGEDVTSCFIPLLFTCCYMSYYDTHLDWVMNDAFVNNINT